MKLEKTASSRKLKSVSTAANDFQAKSASLATAGEKAEKSASRPAKLSRGERQFAMDSVSKYGAERRVYADSAPEQDWLEAEIEIELDRMRNRRSQQYD